MLNAIYKMNIHIKYLQLIEEIKSLDLFVPLVI